MSASGRPVRPARDGTRPQALLPLVPLLLWVAAAPSSAEVSAAPTPGWSAAAPEPGRGDPVLSDSIGPVPARHGLGVADTVTALPPVRVEGRRELVPDRTAATRVRLDRADLTRFLPGSLADGLLAVPGVDLVKTGPWASRVSYRGISGERVLVMVDGVRVNTVRGHGAQASLVPLDQLEHVELLPGATSARFGSDALGGVINLVTHRSLHAPEPRLGVTLTARGALPGGAWSQSLRASYRSPAGGLELSAGLGALDALVTPAGRIPNSGNREDHLGARAATRLGAVQLDLEHSRLAARDVGLPAFNGTAGASGEYPLQGRDATRFEASWPGAGAWPAGRLLAVLQRLETRFDETVVDSAFVRGRYVGTVSTGTADRVTSPAASLAPELRFRGPGDLRLVGEWRLERTDGPRETRETVRNAAGDVTSATSTSGESVPRARRDSWAVGAFLSQSAAGFRFEGGARLDALRSRADSTPASATSRLDVTDRRPSLEAGVSRRVGALEPYAHVATGFRAPNLQERYFNDEVHGGLRLFGNPDLEAERSRSFELGLRIAEAGRHVRELRLSAYRSDVDDLISLDYLGQLYLVPRFQYVNVNRARLEGLEAAGRLQMGGVLAGLSVAVPRGVDLGTGAELLDAGSARVVADLSLPVGRALPHGRLAARWRWSDALTSVDPLFARPAFSTLALEALAVVSGTRVTLAVRNLFDVRYQEPLSFIPEPGRTFAVSVRHDLDLTLSRIGGTR